MKKKITMLFLVAVGATTYAQDIGLGIGKGLPDQSAILDVNSPDKGVLIPRMELKNLTTFDLAGGTGTESMLIYNTVVSPGIAKGFYYWTAAAGPGVSGKWELITSQSQLETIISNLRTEIYDEIKKITQIPGTGGPTDLSYLVAFTPDQAEPSKGVFSYLVPQTDASGEVTYSLKEITLESIIQGTETETYMVPHKEKVLDAAGNTPDTVVGYYYMSEDNVKKWKADPADQGKPIEDIASKYGTYIDIAGIAGDSFIEYLTENKQYIENTFIKIPGGVTLHQDGSDHWYFKVQDGTGGEADHFFNDMETKTKIGKSEIVVAGTLAPFTVNNVAPAPTAVKKGEIYYEYTTETRNGEEKNYINLTQDIITTITNNEDLKEEISNIVNNFLEGGSNVYYGYLNEADIGKPDVKQILFSVDAAGNRTPIDISENIINEINTNTSVQNSIKEVTKIKLVNDVAVPINTSLNGVEVFRLLQGVAVTRANANTPYNMELNAAVDLGANATKVLNIQILDKNGSVVLNTARDIALVGGKLTFLFGNGQTITPLKEGAYDIIVEFTATTPVTP